MFTGIIKEKGIVKSISNGILSISAGISAKSAYVGQSIAVNGLCLTVRKINYPAIFFDFTPATYFASTLKYFKINEKVNLEPALSVNSDISGHFVLGHIDGIGKIVSKRRIGNSIIIGIKIINSIDADIKKYIIVKGSIAIDGISLTVNEIKDDVFYTSIIPLTHDETNIKFKTIGNYVNLESDIIERTVVNRLNNMSGGEIKQLERGHNGLNVKFLAENGFM